MKQSKAKGMAVFFICLLLFAGFYPLVASARDIGPLEITKYEDIVAFRVGNTAF